MKRLLIVGMLIWTCCSNPPSPPQTSTRPLHAIDPQGGEVVDGLQAVLKIDKQIWKPGEVPTFTVSLLEVGPGTLENVDPPAGILVEYDSLRYRPDNLSMSALPPARGGVYGLEGALENLQNISTKQPLVLLPGKHRFRVGFQVQTPKGAQANTAEVWSKPVRIEIKQ